MNTRMWQSSRVVRWVDRIAAWVITFGGMMTIAAVMGVFVFLVWTVAPLFQSASLVHRGTVALGHDFRPREAASESFARESETQQARSGREAALGTAEVSPLLAIGMDESATVAWAVDSHAGLTVWHTASGNMLWKGVLSGDHRPACGSVDPRMGTFIFGTAEGTLLMGSFRLGVQVAGPQQVPPEIKNRLGKLKPFQPLLGDQGFVWWQDQGGRAYQLKVDLALSEPIRLGESPVVLVDASARGETRLVAALTEDGILHVGSLEKKLNFLTGEETVTFSGGSLNLHTELGREFPDHLCVAGVGDSTYLIWNSGRVLRIDSRVTTALQLAERLQVTTAPDRITAFGHLIGKNTLLFGTERGVVTAWFPAKPANPTTPDGVELVQAHRFLPGPASVVGFGASQRTRLFVAGYADGTVRVYHATSEQLVAEDRMPEGQPPVSKNGGRGSTVGPTDLPGPPTPAGLGVALAPKDDALLCITQGRMGVWQLSAPHAGITWRSVFGRVWYEGYPEPAYVWQSSSGADEFEPKYSLTPLIFGTVKATVFAMLFAVPVAFLAAVYTSEILHRNVRGYIKPAIELMAGLPSVVLGFLAALVFAPWVESRLPATLAALYTVPFALLLGGHLMQLLPGKLQRITSRYRVWAMLIAGVMGLQIAAWLGPLAEKWFFAGDLKAWLNGRVGKGAPGWGFALLPLVGLLVSFGMIRRVQPLLECFFPRASRLSWAWLKLGLFLLGVALTLGLSLGMGWLLSEALGVDPRGLFLGTYVQRNAFIVGFVMGFAVIPIIYTIADDALTAVPDHVRAASLGAGATQWQTAVRVVIPTAMSGLFSALMIGLGRAAGETMIVLMAAGNTPILEWNIFSGFRTLSANIAVELPEAVQYSTHYRMLFLAGLCLFLITFVINTAAEIVRLRFRKKAFQL